MAEMVRNSHRVDRTYIISSIFEPNLLRTIGPKRFILKIVGPFLGRYKIICKIFANFGFSKQKEAPSPKILFSKNRTIAQFRTQGIFYQEHENALIKCGFQTIFSPYRILRIKVQRNSYFFWEFLSYKSITTFNCLIFSSGGQTAFC